MMETDKETNEEYLKNDFINGFDFHLSVKKTGMLFIASCGSVSIISVSIIIIINCNKPHCLSQR